MVLNPHLYRALRNRFGSVRVTNDNAVREERPIGGEMRVVERGEHYQVCCPFCDDDKHRLSFSYQYMRSTIAAPGLKTQLVNCYNEGCEEVYEKPFIDDMAQRVRSVKAGSLLDPLPDVERRTNKRRTLRLPRGVKDVRHLSESHPAREFLRQKYPGLPERYLLTFGLLWCLRDDPFYTKSGGRVIFPIHGEDGQLVAWQGRTIEDQLPRWYSPPGFSKEQLFNFWSVPEAQTPIVAEGIPAAVACGPDAVPIYGLSTTTMVIEMFAQRWRSVILALDPDAYVPDNRPGGKGKVHFEILAQRFAEKMKVGVRTIRWPEKILEQARAYNDGLTKVKPPDPADVGVRMMKGLIDGAVPYTP